MEVIPPLTRRSTLGMLAAMACGPATAQPVMRIGTSDSDASLVAAPVLAEAYAHLGLQMEPVAVPLLRGLREAEDGSLNGDLMRSMAAIKEIPGLIGIKVPIYEISVVIYKMGKTCPARMSWQDIGRHKVSILRGVRVLETHLPAAQQVSGGNYDDVLRQLRDGMAEYAAGSELSMDLTALRHGASDMCKVREPIERLPLFHALNRRHADLVPKLERVLEDMRRSGEMARILATGVKRLTDAAQSASHRPRRTFSVRRS